MTDTFKLDDKEYKVNDLSERSQKIVSELNTIERQLREKNDILSIFNKAKKAYMSDLKSEILSQKGGFEIE